MHVQNALMPRVGAMSCDMDETSCRFDLTLPFDHLSVTVDEQKVLSAHFRPVQAIGIDQLALFFSWHDN